MKLNDYAPLFNQIMGIADTFFGRSPKSTTLGAGALRARKRLAEKHKSNKAIPACEVMTRQRLRAKRRAADKFTRVTPAQAHRDNIRAKRSTVAA